LYSSDDGVVFNSNENEFYAYETFAVLLLTDNENLLENRRNLVLSPTLVQNTLSISLDLKHSVNSEMILFDINGKIFGRYPFDGFLNINTEHLLNGMYFIGLTVDGVYLSKEFIKQ